MNDCRTCRGNGADPTCNGTGCNECDPDTGNCPTCAGTGNDPLHWHPAFHRHPAFHWHSAGIPTNG